MALFAPGVAQGAISAMDYQRQTDIDKQLAAQRKQQMDYQAYQMETSRAQQAAQLQQRQADASAWGNYGAPPSAAPQTPSPGQSSQAMQPPGMRPPAPPMFTQGQGAGQQPPPQMFTQGAQQVMQPQTPQVPGPYRTLGQQDQGMPTPNPQARGDAAPAGAPPAVQSAPPQQQPAGMTLDNLIASFKKPTPDFPNGIPKEYWSALIKERMPMLEYQDRQRAAALVERRLTDTEAKTAAAEAAKAPTMRTRVDGTQEIQEQWNAATKSWDKIGAGPRFAKQVGPAGGGAGAGGAPGKVDESIAAQLATGQPMSQVIPGYGKEAVAMRKAGRDGAIKTIMEQTGMSRAEAGVELAARTVEFASGKTSDSKLAIMEGGTRQAVKQLDYNVDQVNEDLKKLKSSDILPVVNAVARGVEKWDGDPAYSALFFHMAAAATESARILAGGQGSVAQLHQGAMEEAQKWANVNMTPAQWGAVSKAMKEEGQARLDTYSDARRSGRVGHKDEAGAGASKGQWKVERVD